MKDLELKRILRRTINESLESKTEEVMEKLYGKQTKLDKNKNGKIDREDFKMLRKKKHVEETEHMEGETCEQCGVGEMVEGECTECGEKKETMYEVEIDGVNESVTLSEDELITLIEEVVKKESDNIKKGTPPNGLAKHQRVHKENGKEGDEYMKSLSKKMKDYTKDGSKGEFDMNPKKFPKGNGELEKMKAKKYTMSDEGKDFIDDYMRPGMENLVPDEIEYDEQWVSDNIKGSSKTGNNPKWANAEETELGDKLTKKMKDQKYRKAKLTAYRKSKQPITDGTGENSGHSIGIKLESKENKQLNEEFDRMKTLITYDRRTQ
jgi:hypothetical protein